MSKKVIIGLVVIVVIILGLSLSGTKTESKVIKIGVIAPQTGGAAVFGNSLVKGIEMAISDLKGTKYKYEIVVEDDGSNAAHAASAASKLVNIDKVDALLTVTSGTGNAAKPIALAAKIPHICDCADITIGNAAYNYTNSIMPDDEMKGWLGEAKKRGVKKLVTLSQIHPGITPVLDLLKKMAPDYGITVVYSEQFDVNTRDFKTMISKAKQTSADLYFIASYPPALDILGKQLVDAGVTNLSTYALFAISATPELFNDKWYTDANLADPAFADRFAKLYPNIRFNVRTAPHGYDNVNLLVQSFEKGGDVNANLGAVTSFMGKIGKTVKTAESHNFRSAPGLWMIKNGKPTILGELPY